MFNNVKIFLIKQLFVFSNEELAITTVLAIFTASKVGIY